MGLALLRGPRIAPGVSIHYDFEVAGIVETDKSVHPTHNIASKLQIFGSQLYVGAVLAFCVSPHGFADVPIG